MSGILNYRVLGIPQFGLRVHGPRTFVRVRRKWCAMAVTVEIEGKSILFLEILNIEEI
jgi:hypothetical protein